MGRGNVRSSSATAGAARKKWFAQKVNQYKQKPTTYGEQRSSQRRVSEGGKPMPLRQRGRYKSPDVARTADRFRARAYREAQRKGLSPEAAKPYVNKRVKELRDTQTRREQRVANRRSVEQARRNQARSAAEMRGKSGFDSVPEMLANRAGRQARRARQDKLRSERIRQQARRRAAGAKSRALSSLRRVTPEAPYLRPARRRRQNLTNQQQERNLRQRGRFINERNRPPYVQVDGKWRQANVRTYDFKTQKWVWKWQPNVDF